MTESTLPANAEGNSESARRGPVLTWLVCATCVAIFFELAQDRSALRETLFNITTASTGYWGLVTSAFVHVQIWHLFLNVYWLWILGGLLEREIPRMYWIIFFLFAAIISSVSELMLTGNTGIGASGVVYAMFGFIWIGKKQYPAFGAIATKQNVNLFLGWLVFCIIATHFEMMSIANGSHVGGLLFGIGTAYLANGKNKEGTGSS